MSTKLREQITKRTMLHSQFNSISRLARQTLTALTCICLVLAADHFAMAQLNLGRRGTRGRSSVFTGATRQVLRPIRLAEAAIAIEDYDRACQLLGDILADDAMADCLVPNETQWMYAKSLQQKAVELLGTLNEDQRQIYREKWTARASQMLDEAVDAADYEKIELVAQRFLYTDAGLEASMLIGHQHLNNGRPNLAGGMFEQVFETPKGRKKYAPDLNLLMAIAYALSSQDKLAVEQLELLKSSGIKEINFFDSQISIFQAGDDPLNWLTEIIGASPLTSQSVVVDWLVFRGNAQRNAETGPGLPLFSPRWTTETISNATDIKDVQAGMETLIKNNVSPLPKSNLLTIDNQLIVRTAETTLGIDGSSGKRTWRFPAFEEVLESQVSNDGDQSVNQVSSPSELLRSVGSRNRRFLKTAKIYERLLQDAVYAKVSSDGRFVFLVPNPGLATGENDWQRYRSDRFSSAIDLQKYNTLCAIDVAAEGARRWEIGGVTGGDEPALAEVFFLGAPLPLDDGKLYCIAVQNAIVKLLAIEAETGALSWQKELASTEEAVDFSHDKVRRLAGAVPSESDGILVCPTGLNALVAVDLTTRSLRWGFQFSDPSLMQWNAPDLRRDKFWRNYNTTWRDTSLTIADGAILYTPVDSKELYCIDLKTGRSRWGQSRRSAKSADRDEAMYVAGVKDNTILLAEPSELRAIDLQTGKRLWNIPFDRYGSISGRGYTSGDFHYLPTTFKKLIRFDLKEKKISKVVETGRVLGNLFPWRTDIISVGIDHIAAYPCDEASEGLFKIAAKDGAEVENPLKQHTQLAIEAQLQLQRQQYAKAAASISQAYDLFPNSTYAGVLVEILTELIRVDYPLAEDIFQRYKTLFAERDLERLRQGKVKGLIKTKRHFEAFSTLLKIAAAEDYTSAGAEQAGQDIPVAQLISIPATEIDKVSTELKNDQTATVEMTRTQWLSVLSMQLLEKVDAAAEDSDVREQMAEAVQQYLAQHAEEPAVIFFNRLRIFPPTLVSSQLRVETAARLYEDGYRIEARSLSSGRWAVEKSTESEVDQEALSRQQELLIRLAIDESEINSASKLLKSFTKTNSEIDSASTVFEELEQAEEEAKQSISKDTLDEQLYLKLAKDKSVRRAPRYEVKPFEWNRFVSDIKESSYAADREGHYLVKVMDSDIEEFKTLDFRYDNGYGELQIHDRLGRAVRSIYLHPDGETQDFSAGTRGKIFIRDSVLLFCIGKEISAIDWSKFVRGDDALMWTIALNQGTSSKNIFGGPWSDGVCYIDGQELKCVDLFSGQTQWVRNQIPKPSTLRDSEGAVSIWNDNRHIHQTFDKTSGSRLSSGEISKQRGASSIGFRSFHLFRTPLRTAPPGEKIKRQLESPFDTKPYSAIKLQCYDFKKGEFVWTKTLPFPSVFHQFDQRTVAVLTRDGDFSVVDIVSGKVKFETSVPEVADESIVQLSVSPFSGRYIVTVNTSNAVSSKFEIDQTEVRFTRFSGRGKLNVGFMFAVSDTTGESLWEKPVKLEKLQLLDSIPYDSPYLILLRRNTYEDQDEENDPTRGRIQVLMVDIENGALRKNHLFNIPVGNQPSCQLVCKPVPKSDLDSDASDAKPNTDENESDGGPLSETKPDVQRLELLIASRKFEIELVAARPDDLPAKDVPASLTHSEIVTKLNAQPDAEEAATESILVRDMSQLEEQARRANEALIEQRKIEAELLEKETVVVELP